MSGKFDKYLGKVREMDAGGGGVNTSILMGAPDYSNARFFTPNTEYVIESNGYLIFIAILGYSASIYINDHVFFNDGGLLMNEIYPVAKGDTVRVEMWGEYGPPDEENALFVPCKTAE